MSARATSTSTSAAARRRRRRGGLLEKAWIIRDGYRILSIGNWIFEFPREPRCFNIHEIFLLQGYRRIKNTRIVSGIIGKRDQSLVRLRIFRSQILYRVYNYIIRAGNKKRRRSENRIKFIFVWFWKESLKREVFSRNLGLNHLIFHRSHTVVSSIGVVQRGLRVRVPRARVCPLRRVNARPDCARAVCVRASLVPAPPLTHTQRRGIVAYCHVSSSTSRYRGRGAVIISNPKEHGRLLAPHPRVVRHPRKYTLRWIWCWF